MVDEADVWENIVKPSIANAFGVDLTTVSRDNTFKSYDPQSIEYLDLAINLADAVEDRYGLPKFPTPNNLSPEPRTLRDLSSYLTTRINEEMQRARVA